MAVVPEDINKTIDALSSMIDASNDDPENGKRFLERSRLYYQNAQYTEAYDDAKSAVELCPQDVDAHIAAAEASLKLNRYNDCYTHYKEGMVLEPKNADVVKGMKELQDVIMADYESKADETPEATYNAVELCSQDYYPGDDELYKLEVEILLKKYKIDAMVVVAPVDVPVHKKKEAATLGVSAYNTRLDGKYAESIQYCKMALDRDPSNYRLMHMRAQAFNDLDEPLHALKDLMKIPKPCRFLDVWRLGGKLLAGLDLPVMAEFWLRKATAMIPEAERRKDLSVQTLFQKVRTARIYGPLTVDFAVKVDFTEFGRAVFATEKLEPGEDAFEDRPVVLGQLLSCIDLPGCAHCAASLITAQHFFGAKYAEFPPEMKSFIQEQWPDVTGVQCEGCSRERYCNESCRTDAWEAYHQIICPSVNPYTSELYDIADNKGMGMNEKGVREEVWVGHYTPLVLAKMWAMIIAEAKRKMKEQGLTEPTKDIWARAKMSLRKFISYGSMSAIQRMPEVFKLMQKVFQDCGDGVSYPINEAEFEARYYQATCNLQAFSSAVTPKNKFMENISQVEDIRALGVLKYLEHKAPAVSFAGMFPLHACMNHACDNNVEVMDGFVDGKPGVQVRVKRDIKPGEEIFTTYIDTSMPRKLRRAWLYKSFNFWCQCKRCQFEGDDNSSCTNCHKKATVEKKILGCGRCKRAWYCSTKCQKQSWVKGHKDICSLSHSDVQNNRMENS